MKNKDYRYIAVFLPRTEYAKLSASMPGQRLAHISAHPHVTFAYEPEQVDPELFGTEVLITATGYACNGENEGVSITLQTDNAQLQQLYAQIAVPHLTLSRALDAESSNTRNLPFEPAEPVTVRGFFGALRWDKQLDLGGMDAEQF